MVPAQEERVETGVVRFGDDWPGYFMRGDNAMGFAITLKQYLDIQEKRMSAPSEQFLFQALRNFSNEILEDVPLKPQQKGNEPV